MVLLVVILTFVLLTGSIQFMSVGKAYGQSSSPYSNCIMLMMEGDTVQLNTDDDCNEAQWNEAVQHYKANGYPNGFPDPVEEIMAPLDLSSLK